MAKKENLRQQLGLSQEEISVYYGVQRAVVAMIESHVRPATTQVVVRQSWLELAIHKPGKQLSAKAKQELQQMTEKDAAIINKLKTKLTLQVSGLQRKLDKMKEHYNKAMLLLSVIPELRSNTEALQSDNKLELWLDITEHDALKKLKENSPAQQTILQTRINSLRMQCEGLG